LLLSLESTDNCMTRLAQNEIYLARSQSVEETLQRLDSISPVDLRSVAEALFQDRSLHLQVLGPMRSADFPNCDLTLL
jgi:predicted Zn-dependent peptidase